ncbi:MAG: hypothetical protein U0412_04445 [Nitrospira sp.]
MMEAKVDAQKSSLLAKLSEMKRVILSTNENGRWYRRYPMGDRAADIFKTSIEQAHGRMGTFSPGFGEGI